MLKRVFCIGETLIDFIPVQKEKSLKEVTSFERGWGSSYERCNCDCKIRGNSVMLTKIANDSFGDYLVDVLEENGVDTSYIIRCNEGETGLAFVSVDKLGDRDFSFYRKNSADLLLLPNEVKVEWFDKGDLLHFCSVDLVESSMKQTHIKVIDSFQKIGDCQF